MSVTENGSPTKRQGPCGVLIAALVLVFALATPAQASIDVTLDIAGAVGGPAGTPETQTPARTGFDPLPMVGVAVLFIALGILGLAQQSRTQRKEATS